MSAAGCSVKLRLSQDSLFNPLDPPFLGENKELGGTPKPSAKGLCPSAHPGWVAWAKRSLPVMRRHPLTFGRDLSLHPLLSFPRKRESSSDYLWQHSQVGWAVPTDRSVSNPLSPSWGAGDTQQASLDT